MAGRSDLLSQNKAVVCSWLCVWKLKKNSRSDDDCIERHYRLLHTGAVKWNSTPKRASGCYRDGWEIMWKVEVTAGVYTDSRNNSETKASGL